MIVTPKGYTKHYYNGSQRIAVQIGKLEDLPNDIIDNSAVAMERIANARAYMDAILNISEIQPIDTTSIFADIEGDALDELQWQCNDEEWTLNTTVHCDSNLLYPILTKDTTNLNKRVSDIYYYHPDHLGNVREVWVYPWLNHSECVQRTQYYPSGLPWNEGYSPSEQPYKYGGKEFVEMHGLDEYDSEARWYYPAIMRTTTMDPHCEQYYDTSPYVWCGNNPVNMIDPTGRDTINVSYNAKNGKWEFTNPIIAEGNDIFQVTDISGNMQSYTFSENEYKGRVNFLNLENDGKGSYNLGIYHVSGATEEGGTGFYVTPGGEASLEVGSGARIPDGVYPLFGAVGKKWITLGIGGSVLNRAIRIHSAPSSHETTNPLVWTEGCFVLFPDSLLSTKN